MCEQAEQKFFESLSQRSVRHEAELKKHAIAVEEAVIHRQGSHAFAAAAGIKGEAAPDEISEAANASHNEKSLEERNSIRSQKTGGSSLKDNHIWSDVDVAPISSWSLGWREGRAAREASIGSRRGGAPVPPRAQTHSLTRAETHTLSLPLSGTGVDMQSLRSGNLSGSASHPVL